MPHHSGGIEIFMIKAKGKLNSFINNIYEKICFSAIALMFSCILIILLILEPITISAEALWESDPKITETGDFTLIAIPDMQYISGNKPENLTKITEWINKNKASENIRFAMFLGDMTNENKKSEWENVRSATDTLSVPFSVIYGNRDMNRAKEYRNVNRFMSAYPLDTFQAYSEYGGAFENNSLNTYYKFEYSGLKYMIMALEFAPRDDVLKWAGEIIEANPDHNVIITTHGYLDDDGNIISDSSSDSFLNYSYLGEDGNNGSEIWNKLIRKHKNIVLLLCGHRGDGDVIRRTDTGDHGNKVQTIMVNGTKIDESTNGDGGMILKIHVKASSGEIYCEYYSTVSDSYYKSSNQFKEDICVVAADGSVSLSGIKLTPNNASSTANSDQSEQKNMHDNLNKIIAISSALFIVLATVIAISVLKNRKKQSL